MSKEYKWEDVVKCERKENHYFRSEFYGKHHDGYRMVDVRAAKCENCGMEIFNYEHEMISIDADIKMIRRRLNGIELTREQYEEL